MKRSLTDLQRKKSGGGNTFSDSILSRVTSRDWEKDEDIAEDDVVLDNKVSWCCTHRCRWIQCCACCQQTHGSCCETAAQDQMPPAQAKWKKTLLLSFQAIGIIYGASQLSNFSAQHCMPHGMLPSLHA